MSPIPDRELSAKEYEVYKSGNRSTKRQVLRGRRIRENAALEEKMRGRAVLAKKRARKERRKERLRLERLKKKEFTPLIGVE